MTKEKNLKQDRIHYWLSVGAKSSETVHNLLVLEGIIKAKKIPVHKKSKKEKIKPKEKILPPERESIESAPKKDKRETQKTE